MLRAGYGITGAGVGITSMIAGYPTHGAYSRLEETKF
jgi:hypothetical protein